MTGYTPWLLIPPGVGGMTGYTPWLLIPPGVGGMTGYTPWLLIPPGVGGIGSDSNVEKKGVSVQLHAASRFEQKEDSNMHC
jgi:hypothetical protein